MSALSSWVAVTLAKWSVSLILVEYCTRNAPEPIPSNVISCTLRRTSGHTATCMTVGREWQVGTFSEQAGTMRFATVVTRSRGHIPQHHAPRRGPACRPLCTLAHADRIGPSSLEEHAGENRLGLGVVQSRRPFERSYLREVACVRVEVAGQLHGSDLVPGPG